ncbi:hypothetical protein [Nonomuraea sp. NPDC049750]|uniref:hypothetical protein n=1 Tax=Nonomuraea sp. NPDC049750 TaxID=3154738 RepID=UPI0033C9C114
MTVHDLRDVLREHGDGPSPANLARHEEIAARIRRIRLRRRMLGGGGVVAVAAAVALGVSLLPGLLPGSAETRRGPAAEATATPTGLTGLLPEQFTASDGTKYRRIAITSIKRTGPTKVSVTIPVSGKPLDVAAVCAGPNKGGVRVSTSAHGPASAIFTRCSKRMELQPLPVPGSTSGTKLTVTFDAIDWDCTSRNGKCVQPKTVPGAWSLAVYEWTPPARPVEPPPFKELPDHVGKAQLAERKTGVWPQESSATFKVRGKAGFAAVCTGDLAGRLLFSFEVDGRQQFGSRSCSWEGSAFPSAVSDFANPTDRTTTVKVTWTMLGSGTNRPVRWSFGVYRK